jgi:hypothetical protein
MPHKLTSGEARALYRAVNNRVTPRLAKLAREHGEPQAALVTTALVLGWLSDAGFTRQEVLGIVDAHFPTIAPPQLTVVNNR